MATLKHINSKNADYGAAEQYLLFEHDEFTMKPVLDETGRLIPREDYRLSTLNCDGLDVSQRGYCKRRRESVDGQGFLRSCIEKDRSALIVSAGKTHKIKSGCLLNVTEIRTSEIEARAIR